MSLPDSIAAEEPSGYREGGVEQERRKAENDCDSIDSAANQQDAQQRECVSKKQAPGVSHEDGCRRIVGAEKPKGRCRHHQGAPRYLERAGADRESTEGRPCNDAYASRQSITAVHKVK